ncbi:MAG: oligosaccharide flippase family protein [Salinivirgaceae bacterium]
MTLQILPKLSQAKQTALFFSFSAILMSVIQMGTNLLVIRWVSPEEIGVWNTFNLVLVYGMALQLGIFNGLNREYPFLLGSGDKYLAMKLASTALFIARVCMLISLIATILVFLFLLSIDGYSIEYSFALLIVGLNLVLMFYQNYLLVTYRTNKAFNQLAAAYLWQSLLLLISLPIVYFYAYWGLLIRFLLLAVSLILLLNFKKPLKIVPEWNYHRFKTLLKTGMPIFVNAYLQGFASTINRIVLVDLAGFLAIGLYSPALAVLGVSKLLPSVLGQFLYPKMSFEFGKNNDKVKLWKWTWQSSLGIMAILAPFAIMGWYLMPYVVELFFPKYTDGIEAAQFAIISGVFSAATVGFVVLSSLKAFKIMYFITTIKIVLNIVFMYLMVAHFPLLLGVSMGLVISDILFFVIGLISCRYALNRK